MGILLMAGRVFLLLAMVMLAILGWLTYEMCRK